MTDNLMQREETLEALVSVGHRLDAYLSHPAVLRLHPHYQQLFPDLKRDADNPPYVEMPPEWQEKSRAYYRTPEELMQHGPACFTGLSGQVYEKTPQGYAPALPECGLVGPGRMGVGRDAVTGRPVPESRTIDLVPFLFDATHGIRIFGGMRGDTGQPCFVGGFVEGDVFKSMVREFIEEAVSGSLTVEAAELAAYPGHDDGEKKFHYLAAHDPATLERVAGYFKERLSVGYKGPVLADPNRTNDRWIATTAFSGFINMSEVEAILGESPFQLKLVAGSDLGSTKLHTFGQDFLTQAFASHGPIACLALADTLRKTGPERAPQQIFDQITRVLADTADFLDRHPLPMRNHESPAGRPPMTLHT